LVGARPLRPHIATEPVPNQIITRLEFHSKTGAGSTDDQFGQHENSNNSIIALNTKLGSNSPQLAAKKGNLFLS
ncbi:MAG: hypothetical protein V3S64_01825, partial [bacterium]